MSAGGATRHPPIGLREPSGTVQAPTGMAEETAQVEVISMDARARDMLRELVSAGGKPRYVRIHAGRG
jgi:hypothetical protein